MRIKLKKSRLLFSTSLHRLRKRLNNCILKMENHLTGAFLIIKLTPLYVLFRKISLLKFFQFFINPAQVIHISPIQQFVFLNRSASYFLLPIFSLFSTFFSCNLFMVKTCFSPGCRSPPHLPLI